MVEVINGPSNQNGNSGMGGSRYKKHEVIPLSLVHYGNSNWRE
jgi:hypothetical protein